ncbi:hypothetical protein H8N03_14815 [Ramlibacter sp. USB13]|uniref:Uncharacterized protein n=1 Tax=Ramlibacter cellulosilyticus TaxID=2764187 RepID=A0A923MSL1_9BURK|nr:hypothetical protein [Ramlibacter cellulosilyticus]MBC5784221.1 hypothetical protein [Ramlibacter cellulosilyticus]
MQDQQLKQRIATLEQAADDAKRACQNAGQVAQDLKECVTNLHSQASAAKHATEGQQSATQDSLRQDLLQLEETADRAMQACRSAGNVDPRLQQAIQRAHAEASSLKKELMQAA